MPTQSTQTRKITITVDTKGSQELKKISDQLGGLNKNTKQLANQFDFLKGAATSFLGGLGVRELIAFSDEIQGLNNRLLAMTGNQEAASQTMAQLVGVARETNQSLAGVSDGYFRMSLALKDAGISQSTLIDLTKTVANTFRLSGASTQEAANATIQLGQAFSLGVLRGQDLRSVMSQNVTLTRLLRKEFGNNLLKDAEKGLITVPKLMEILYKNMDQVNNSAKTMSATFEQSLTKAIDAVKLKVFDLSKAMSGPGSAAEATQFFIKHLDDFVAVGTVIAVATLPALITGIKTLTGSLGLLNPYTAVVAIETLVLYFASGARDAKEFFILIKVGFADIEARADGVIASFYELRAAITIGQAAKDALIKTAAEYRNAATDHLVHARALQLEYQAQRDLEEQQNKTAKSANNWAADIAKAKKAFAQDLTPQQMLERLNATFRSGAIDVRQYNDAILDFDLAKANYKFKEGKINLDQLNEAQRKVDLARLNRAFAAGSINVSEFSVALKKLEFDKLIDQFNAGKISVEKFNSELAALQDNFSANGAFRTGLQDYVTSIGTSTQQVAGLIKNTFSNMEEAIFQFVKKGKFSFTEFTQAVLDDLLRIIIRMSIIQPIAKGLLDYASTPSTPVGGGYGSAGGSTGSVSGVAAKGAYFDGGVSKFAAGGVIGSPTLFRYGSGKTGLMGEAGPEAIIPLKRGSGGELGVKASITPVTINIINQSGNEVKQTETTGPNGDKQIEILVTSKVREGFSTGKYDKIMKSAYGLSRRGS